MGFRFSPLAAALCATLSLAACGEQTAASGGGPPGGGPGGPGGGQPAEVAYMALQAQTVPRVASLPGRVAPSATADVRPQAEGVIRRMNFREGAQVRAGDALFELESPRPRIAVETANTALSSAQASLAAAQASLGSNEAALLTAQAKYERSSNLYGRGFLSRADMDAASAGLASAQAAVNSGRANVESARAGISSARAGIETARVNIDYTTVRAPISGVIGKAAVNVGDLVTTNQTTALATIRQLDPVYVDLADTSANILRLREEIRAGRIGDYAGAEPKIRLTLETGTAYEHEGRVSLTDTVVSESTSTLTLRATVPNPEGLLLPGMYVRATVELGSSSAVLAPQRAVMRNAAGEPIAYVVGADNKIESRTLKLNGAQGNDWIVMEGLKPEDKLVLDGFQKISPGAAVRPVPGSVNADGVVSQEIKG